MTIRSGRAGVVQMNVCNQDVADLAQIDVRGIQTGLQIVVGGSRSGLDQGDAGRVVAAVLEAAQALDEPIDVPAGRIGVGAGAGGGGARGLLRG